jgi:hypothetical protein
MFRKVESRPANLATTQPGSGAPLDERYANTTRVLYE